MGASAEEGEKVAAQKVPNGKEVKMGNRHEDSNAQVTKENVGGCCQGANGFSCCRDGSSNVTEEKKLKETKGGNLSTRIKSLEKRDVLAAAAMVGAVATVAVAYSVYRRWMTAVG